MGLKERNVVVETECSFCKHAISAVEVLEITSKAIEFKCPRCGKVNKFKYEEF